MCCTPHRGRSLYQQDMKVDIGHHRCISQLNISPHKANSQYQHYALKDRNQYTHPYDGTSTQDRLDKSPNYHRSHKKQEDHSWYTYLFHLNRIHPRKANKYPHCYISSSLLARRNTHHTSGLLSDRSYR